MALTGEKTDGHSRTHPEGVEELCLWGTVLGRRVMPCRAFLVDGLLVDNCHIRGRRDFAAWADSRAIELAVLTHGHEDHAGNSAWLDAKGITVLAHPEGVAMGSEVRSLPFFEWVVWGTPEPCTLRPVPSHIEAGRHGFTVVKTPGHTIDHIVLLEANEGWLFSGDLYLNDRLLYLYRDEDLASLLASLDKVLRLDFDTLYCAHRGRVADGHRTLTRKRDFLLELGETARALQSAGADEVEITGRLLGREGMLAWVSLGDFSKRRLVHRILQLGSPAAKG